VLTAIQASNRDRRSDHHVSNDPETNDDDVSPDEAQAEVVDEPKPVKPPARWSEVWHLPALVGAAGMLVVGIMALMLTRPETNFDMLLDELGGTISNKRYEGAFAKCRHLDTSYDLMSPTQQSRFHALRGDLYYSRQFDEGGLLEENLTRCIGDYHAAEELGAELTPDQLYRVTDSLINLSRINEAHEFLARIPAANATLRHRLIRSLVERNIALRDMDYDRTFELLGQLLAEPDLDREDRIWAIANRAELQIERGYVVEAVNGLLVAIQQLTAEGYDQFPALYVLLGRGYYELGDHERSLEHLNYASKWLEATDELRSSVLFLLGRIAQNASDMEEAFLNFDTVIKELPSASAYLPSLLGRAEIYAQTDRFPPALEDYTNLIAQLVDLSRRGKDRRDITSDDVTASMIVWHDRLQAAGDLVMAKRFLKAAERLYESGEPIPDNLLVRLANTHAEFAQSLLDGALQAGRDVAEKKGLSTALITRERLDPATQVEIRQGFLSAAEYYRTRAIRNQLDDPQTTLDSLWSAAQAFDKGGDYVMAIESLKQFIQRSAGEPRQVDGMYFLGRCYQSVGDYAGAIVQFRELIDRHTKTLAAEHSYVPLAQCHLSRNTGEDAIEAERILSNVVISGAPAGPSDTLGPTSSDYKDALVELGSLYLDSDRYQLSQDPQTYPVKAVEILDEAVKRCTDDPRIVLLQYRLAHAYRRYAAMVEKELELEHTYAQRADMSSRREQYLEEAVANYASAINGFEQIKVHQRTPLEKQCLKLAYLWKADCVFQLGRFAEARDLFEEIANRYPEDTVALTARMQIVNAYVKEGNYNDARTAHRRALRMLTQFPDSAFDGELLNAEGWEEWLRSSQVIE
jgi:tetratricopeptide (TPR) repeat protein